MLVRKLQQTSRMTQFLQKYEIFLGICFHAFPRCSDRSEFISDYSLQIETVICLYASVEKHVFTMYGLSL